jgi:NDP-sugar pyrophosphorylase family protein
MNGTEEDIGADLLPKLAKKGMVEAYYINDVLFDIGESVKKYEEIMYFKGKGQG